MDDQQAAPRKSTVYSVESELAKVAEFAESDKGKIFFTKTGNIVFTASRRMI